MIGQIHFSKYGRGLFLLLCIVLLMGHFQGMITLYTIFCILFFPKINEIDKTSALLLIFTFFYLFFSYINGAIYGSSLLIYGLPWFIFYNYGKFIVNDVKTERAVVDLLIIIAICMGLPTYFSIVQKIITSGSIVDVTRSFYFFNDESNMVGVTGICVGIFMGYSGLPAFFLLSGWKRERWAFLALFILSILTAINVVTRFPIIVAAVCFLLIVYLKYKGRPLRFLGAFMLMTLIVFVLYYQGGEIGQVFEAYSARNENAENVATLGSRTLIWAEAFHNLVYYPFGWYGIKSNFSFMHNMWLDIARYSGLFPFILLCVITIKSFVTNIRIIALTKSSLAFILLSLNLCFCMVVFVEPVFGGLAASLGCMIWGIQEAYFKRLKLHNI